MEQALIIEIVENHLKDSELYLVNLRIESNNKITVEIDGDRPISIDDCSALSQYIELRLNRNIEDYELEVSSAGISQSFKVVRQYRKAIGQEVETLLKAGRKYSGILKQANENGIVLTIKKYVKLEGMKRKIFIEKDLSFNYNDIKHTKYVIKL